MFFIKLPQTSQSMGSVSCTSSKSSLLKLANTTQLNQYHFADFYDLGEEIGSGSFASVNKCKLKDDLSSNSPEFAVKITNKRYLSKKELIGLRDEIQILQHISHKNVIKLIDAFDNGNNVYMVLELCSGKDLFDEIVSSKNNHFTQSKSAQITYDMSCALQHLHSHGILHRDLKPENILFGTDGVLKITDFGLAHYEKATHATKTKLFPEIILCNTCCGTPHYVAPEIIMKNQYTYKCDIWSVGVILYIMLVGYQPFNASSLNQIYKLISKGMYNFNSRRWKFIEHDAKHLVKCLMEIDPNKRYSSRDINKHPFIIKHKQS